MKKVSKLLAVLLVALMAMTSLAACGGGQDAADPGNGNDPADGERKRP